VADAGHAREIGVAVVDDRVFVDLSDRVYGGRH
jgi:hypothetical protein